MTDETKELTQKERIELLLEVLAEGLLLTKISNGVTQLINTIY